MRFGFRVPATGLYERGALVSMGWGRARPGAPSTEASSCRMLAQGSQTARLETRTKESNMCASRWVTNPRGASNLTEQHRPTMIFCERFECEHACWDPKDGELCLSRAKPEETLVEARSDTDVQIVRRTWV